MKKLFFGLVLLSGFCSAESTKTLFNPFTGRLDYITKVDSTTLPSGSTQYIQNTSTLQSGSTFYVSSGTVKSSLSLGTGASFYIDVPNNIYWSALKLSGNPYAYLNLPQKGYTPGLIIGNNSQISDVWDTSASSGAMISMTLGQNYTLAQTTSGVNANVFYANLNGNYGWGTHMEMPTTSNNDYAFVCSDHGANDACLVGKVDDTGNTSKIMQIYTGGPTLNSAQHLIEIDAASDWHNAGATPSGSFNGDFEYFSTSGTTNAVYTLDYQGNEVLNGVTVGTETVNSQLNLATGATIYFRNPDYFMTYNSAIGGTGGVMMTGPANGLDWYVANNTAINLIQDSNYTPGSASGSLITENLGKVFTVAQTTSGLNANGLYTNFTGAGGWGAHENMGAGSTMCAGYVAGVHGSSDTAFVSTMDDTTNTGSGMHLFQSGAVGNPNQNFIQLDAQTPALAWLGSYYSGIATGTVINTGSFTGHFEKYLLAGTPEWSISSGGIVDTYRGQTTTAGGIPAILVNGAVTAQSASIGLTPVLTPVANGEYRVHVYLETTTTGSAGTVLATVGWTDDAQAETQSTSALSLTAKGQLNQTFFLRALTSAAITLGTTVAGATGSPAYSFYWNIERLF